MKPVFSVLIPVCNQVGLMDQCIESLHAQTMKDFEVIMVDDGSKDASYEMLQGFCAEDERFLVIKHDENKSLLTARFTAMAAAKGDYIFFLDSDDYIEPTCLEVLKNYFETTPTDVVRFGMIREPMGEVVTPPASEDPLADVLKGVFPPAIWKNSYRRCVIDKVLERCQPFYCNMGEDSFFATVFFDCAESYGAIDDALYHYVIGAGMSNTAANASMAKLQKGYESVERSGKNIIAYLEKYNPSYVELGEKKLKSMCKFVLIQNVIGETDYCNVIEYLKLFDKPEYRDIYEEGCRELIKLKVLHELTHTDERFAAIKNEVGMALAKLF